MDDGLRWLSPPARMASLAEFTEFVRAGAREAAKTVAIPSLSGRVLGVPQSEGKMRHNLPNAFFPERGRTDVTERTMSTDSRKLKIGILVGGGVLAAAAVVYFGNLWPLSRGTEGAIGQRQLYRNGNVQAADVAVAPGTSPVAMRAYLQSKEFREKATKIGVPSETVQKITALALQDAAFSLMLSNTSFQNLLSNASFQNLLSNASFQNLLSNASFQNLLSNASFQALLSNASFQAALNNQVQLNSVNLQSQLNSVGFQSTLNNTGVTNLQTLLSNASFQALLSNTSFQALLSNASFQSLLSNAGFQNLLSNASFQNLLSNASFQAALSNASLQAAFSNASLQSVNLFNQ